jgi:hypothetical protein
MGKKGKNSRNTSKNTKRKAKSDDNDEDYFSINSDDEEDFENVSSEEGKKLKSQLEKPSRKKKKTAKSEVCNGTRYEEYEIANSLNEVHWMPKKSAPPRELTDTVTMLPFQLGSCPITFCSVQIIVHLNNY